MRLFNIGVVCAALLIPRISAAQAQAHDDDPVRHGAAWGAAIGAAGMMALARQSVDWCGIGCEADGSEIIALLPGALIGALVGWIADKDAGKTQREGQRFHARIGPTVMHSWFDSPMSDGTYPSAGISATFQPSPHVTISAEYRHARAEFRPAPGAVPQRILDNVVAASSRVAGWARAPYSRQVGATLTEMAGGRLPSFGRVSVEILGGFFVQEGESRNYYDAWYGPTTVPGNYHVLNFESADLGYVYGSNVEIEVTRNLMLVPAMRATHARGARNISAGAGIQWRF